MPAAALRTAGLALHLGSMVELALVEGVQVSWTTEQELQKKLAPPLIWCEVV